jgi:SM-20-related protein
VSTSDEFELGDPSIVALGEGRALTFDGLLGSARAAAIRAQALEMLANGELRPAGIGRGAAVIERTRGDSIAWIEPDPDSGFAPLIDRFTALMRSLNRLAYLGARRLELQVAVYERGFGYAPHIDALAGTASRRATVIYYANEWRAGDGGELEVHEPAGVRVITPIADRLVVFRSDIVAHVVREVAHGPRVAISGWLRSDD